jgi:hypothetical protein
MLDNSYETVWDAIAKLSPADRARLISALASESDAQETIPSRRHSILELRGLGKDVWAGINPDEYVDKERAAWNG